MHVYSQDEKPVYFASKVLTDVQKGYAVIELELLAVAWAMEKFHHFFHASHFILETNQKLLEAILSKSINQATPRLQIVLIRTFPLSFYCVIYTRIVRPASSLLLPIRWPEGHYKVTKMSCLPYYQPVVHEKQQFESD